MLAKLDRPSPRCHLTLLIWHGQKFKSLPAHTSDFSTSLNQNTLADNWSGDGPHTPEDEGRLAAAWQQVSQLPVTQLYFAQVFQLMRFLHTQPLAFKQPYTCPKSKHNVMQQEC